MYNRINIINLIIFIRFGARIRNVLWYESSLFCIIRFVVETFVSLSVMIKLVGWVYIFISRLIMFTLSFSWIRCLSLQCCSSSVTADTFVIGIIMRNSSSRFLSTVCTFTLGADDLCTLIKLSRMLAAVRLIVFIRFLTLNG